MLSTSTAHISGQTACRVRGREHSAPPIRTAGFSAKLAAPSSPRPHQPSLTNSFALSARIEPVDTPDPSSFIPPKALSVRPSIEASKVGDWHPRCSFGWGTLQGLFHSNEDRVRVVEDVATLLGDVTIDCGTSVILVCDGHDGSACAEFVAKKAFVPALREAMVGSSKPTDWSSVLQDTFKLVETEWAARFDEFVRNRAGITPLMMTSPACAGSCVTAIIISGSTIAAANVGDCRAVLRRADGSVLVLTEDHRCSNVQEAKRIREAGGFIRNNRVIGILEPSRTIGDLFEKTKAGAGVISAEPATFVHELRCAEVGPMPTNSSAAVSQTTHSATLRSQTSNWKRALPRTSASLATSTPGSRLPRAFSVSDALLAAASSTESCIVCASDGVWDVLPSEAVAAIAVYVLAKMGDCTMAANEIIHMAKKLGSADDISAVVVRLTAS
jgi:serine/threonine protein phosphatase PrpC